MRSALRFTQSADEVFWPTVFLNSPLCHQAIRLSHGREFFLYLWPVNPARTGETALRLGGKVAHARTCTHTHTHTHTHTRIYIYIYIYIYILYITP